MTADGAARLVDGVLGVDDDLCFYMYASYMEIHRCLWPMACWI